MLRCLIPLLYILALLDLPGFASADSPSPPNVLLIMADDLGYSDLGCYGSEIATPTLDRLAENGLRFNQFSNTAKCHSSRICILTGRYPHQAGNRKLDQSVTIAETLKSAGYFTAMTGKWHLQQQPTDFGFNRYFGHLSGACNYYRGDDTFHLNGEKWSVPQQGFYTTIANVDYSLQFLNEARQQQRPWFLYVAFNAPHAPLQPLEEDYRRYLGRYDAGWDVVRAGRVERQNQQNLFSPTFTASPRPDHIPAWDKLTEEQQDLERKRMTAYAGLVDRIDQEIGRLVDDLTTAGELDNTLIIFVSDNGASPYDRRRFASDIPPYEPHSRWGDGTGWAWVRNTPFRYYKQNQFEGGIATPCVVHWPAGLKTASGAVVDQPGHLIDLLPTIADAADAEIPQSWTGRNLQPIAGISLLPVLRNETLPSRPPLFLHYASDRGMRMGDWKLTSFRSRPWELYNLATDRSELHNLADDEPEVRDRLIKLWHEMAEKVDGTPGSQRQPVSTEVVPHHNPLWTNFSTRNSANSGRRERRGAGAARQ